MSSKSIHIVTHGRISLFSLIKQHFRVFVCVCINVHITISVFSHLSVDIYAVCMIWRQRESRCFSKEDILIAQKCTERCSISHMDMQIKTTIRYHFTLTRMTKREHISSGETVKKLEFSCTVAMNVNSNSSGKQLLKMLNIEYHVIKEISSMYTQKNWKYT